MKRHVIQSEDARLIYLAYKRGFTYDEIANAIYVSKSTLTRWLKQMQIPAYLRASDMPTYAGGDIRNFIKDSYQRGFTLSNIVAELQYKGVYISRRQIGNIVKRLKKINLNYENEEVIFNEFNNFNWQINDRSGNEKDTIGF